MVWQRLYVYHEMPPIWDNNLLPNKMGDSLTPPVMNPEFQKLLSEWQQKYDITWFKIQSSLTRCISFTLKLNEIVTAST